MVGLNLTNKKWAFCEGLDLGHQFRIHGFDYLVLKTCEQAAALEATLERHGRPTDVYYDRLNECCMVCYREMAIGIEDDGYTHT